MKKLVAHILSMKDDAVLSGHPEWLEIVKDAEEIAFRHTGSKDPLYIWEKPQVEVTEKFINQLDRPLVDAIGKDYWFIIQAHEIAKEEIRNCKVKEVTVGEIGLMAKVLNIPMEWVTSKLINEYSDGKE